MKIFKITFLALLASLSSFAFQGETISIDTYVKGMEKHPGYFTFYYDKDAGKILLEINNLNEEFLYISSITAGLGSNDVGLDRNRLGATKIVAFKRFGPKVLLVQPNYSYRANSNNPDEVKAVKDAFANSVIYGFKIAAEDDKKLLIDISPLLLSDLNNISPSLKRSGQGDYRLDLSRSAVYPDNIKNFPNNSEFEALITFTSVNAGSYVRSVSPDGSSVTMRQHLSFVKLPEPGYKTRVWDPRSSFGAISYMDFATPVDKSITKRFIRRHRLEKKNPSAKISEAVEPIVYFVDRGAPEPIRSALVEGASWWNQAFEAAGFKDAFLVKVLPEGADPMDVRYNMINWVHRSTRGWSYGSSVTDPRTGEIIKGHIALGSQRIRQDFLIASGLVAEYEEGKGADPAIMALALLRIKQLSCHEVGHTLGLNHNYASSTNSRASVMDYPHPLVKLNGNKIDLSEAYTNGIGEWDKVSIKYGYSQFPENSNEKKELNRVLETAFNDGLIYLTDQDSRGTHPLTHVWDNGTHPVDELVRVMKIRKIALDNFSAKKLRPGESLSALEEILVPVYLFHRYQITASAAVIGGLYYNHNVRGGPQSLPEFVSTDEQIRALNTLLEVIEPENLAIDEDILTVLPPRAPGLRQSRELFDGYTGIVFDPLAAAENITELTVGSILDPSRLARLIVNKARNSSQPEATVLIDKLLEQTWYKNNTDNMYGELQRSVNYIVLEKLIQLAANTNNAPQVRAIADLKLWELKEWISESIDKGGITDNSMAMYYYGLKQIDFYIEYPEKIVIRKSLVIPQGAPIGSY